MRVLICGSRDWALYAPVRDLVASLDPDEDVVLEGGAPGADALARLACEELEVPFWEFPAAWKRHGGRRAGPIRNGRMIRQGRPDRVVAFHGDPGLGRGTRDMVEKARSAGVPTEVHLADEYPEPEAVDF